MNFEKLLKGRTDCECKKEHLCPIKYAKDLKDRYTVLWLYNDIKK